MAPRGRREEQTGEDNNVAEEEEEMAEEQNEYMDQEKQEEENIEIMDSSSSSTFPLGEVIDSASPVWDYAYHSAGGGERCGWLSDDHEETDPDEGSVVDEDDDDEMIQLTPQPLCEELKELLREVRGGEKKRKRPTRWDT